MCPTVHILLILHTECGSTCKNEQAIRSALVFKPHCQIKLSKRCIVRDSPRHDHVHVTHCEPPHVHKCLTEYKLPRTVEDQNNSLIYRRQGLNYLNYFFGVSPLACKDVGY